MLLVINYAMTGASDVQTCLAQISHVSVKGLDAYVVDKLT